MLPACLRLDWVKLDERLGASVDTWRHIATLPTQEKTQSLTTLRKGRMMYEQAHEVGNIPWPNLIWMPRFFTTLMWMMRAIWLGQGVRKR